MKKVNKGPEPLELQEYRTNHPNHTWTQYRKSRIRRNAVRNQLISDQAGLYAYCEIDLKEAATPSEEDDCRVEHFYPKSLSTVLNNRHLEWDNLLAVCHGGSQRNVISYGSEYN